MFRSLPLTLFWFVYMGSVGIVLPYYSLYLKENAGRALIDLYKELAARFPHGLADQEALPEEMSGFVQRASAKRSEVTYVAAEV